ncbi:hypothetical protein [Kribbella sindirgiensis]|uniref:hypothetical protein n=1 Tax=Kribbella sindirgiensis TaxID=1124744 RepID=UPI001EDE0E92|nr:hypothetical protein [Kribbella sindirgiensis]
MRGGESAAYGELVDRHASVAKRTAAFRPWLLRIVANETRNVLRARGRRARREELAAPLDVVLDPADAAVSLERRTELLTAVRALPRRLREALPDKEVQR